MVPPVCFGPLADSPRAVGVVFQSFRTALGLAPELGMRLAMVRVAPADRQVLRQPSTRRRLGDTFIEGLRPGVVGPITDLTLFARPWQIDLATARMPARIWLGSKDLDVPRSAAAASPSGSGLAT
ncbi:MAG: hypothetical protein R3D67_17980 [Hyphomicrobiaceae bacterium]